MNHVPVPLRLLLAIVLAACALVGVACASGRGTIEVPASVAAGRLVELRWRGIPADIEEAELLLSLDGGRSYPVRLTPELEARTTSFRWRVPDLPTEQAVLMLRVGDEEGERTGALSSCFRILHVEGAPAPDLGFHEGEMWTGFEPTRGPAESAIVPPAPCFEDGPAVVSYDTAAAAPHVGRPAPARAPILQARPGFVPGAVRLGVRPFEVPLRI
jgi:hypothetical protein